MKISLPACWSSAYSPFRFQKPTPLFAPVACITRDAPPPMGRRSWAVLWRVLWPVQLSCGQLMASTGEFASIADSVTGDKNSAEAKNPDRLPESREPTKAKALAHEPMGQRLGIPPSRRRARRAWGLAGGPRGAFGCSGPGRRNGRQRAALAAGWSA